MRSAGTMNSLLTMSLESAVGPPESPPGSWPKRGPGARKAYEDHEGYSAVRSVASTHAPTVLLEAAMLPPVDKRMAQPERLRYPLCACGDDWGACCLATLVPCKAYGESRAFVGDDVHHAMAHQGGLSAAQACSAGVSVGVCLYPGTLAFVWPLACVLPCAYAMQGHLLTRSRIDLRKRLGIPLDDWTDWICSFACPCLSLNQLYREVKSRDIPIKVHPVLESLTAEARFAPAWSRAPPRETQWFLHKSKLQPALPPMAPSEAPPTKPPQW